MKKTLKRIPNNIKYRFFFKRKIKNNFILTSFLKTMQYGSFSLVSTTNFKISYRSVESARIAISKRYKRITKIWLRITFSIPVSSKPQVRMGKGKGKVARWICNIRKGQILIEIDNLPFNEAYKVLFLAAQKIPGSLQLLLR